MEKIKEENIMIKFCPDLTSKEEVVPMTIGREDLQRQRIDCITHSHMMKIR